MTLTELDIKTSYRTGKNNVVLDFLIPALRNSVKYQRATGFFSSSALVHLSEGICELVKNNGVIEIVTSPNLSQEDIRVLLKTYDTDNVVGVVEDELIEMLDNPTSEIEKHRLNLMANLIRVNRLNIKLAFTNSNSKITMYHEKIGILTDSNENRIAFTGSMNESANAFFGNYESIDCFCSWKESDNERVQEKSSDFSQIYNNNDPALTVVECSRLKNTIVEKYLTDEFEWHLDLDDIEFIRPNSNKPKFPPGFEPRPYQEEAIVAWIENNNVGVFDMATGTGKTKTAISAYIKLLEGNPSVPAIIVAPYQHLVEQWAEDLEEFNVFPIVCHSASSDKNYKQTLARRITLAKSTNDFSGLCIVTTNATFNSDWFSLELQKLPRESLIIVDEAHNFGAKNLNERLPDHFDYKLALSATFERYSDAVGTSLLYSYFDKVVYSFSLERAINDGFLTPYEYHPVICVLNDEERQEYNYLSEKIGKAIAQSLSSSFENLPDSVKLLLIKRSRIIAQCSNKLDKLRELFDGTIDDYSKSKNMLIYCGAVSGEYTQGNNIDEEQKQVDAVVKMLGIGFGVSCDKFVAETSIDNRSTQISSLISGNFQAIVAIKCLDEGVDIPSVQTAFILASSTNPREYVQRRGRVLRKSAGKDKAVIYDFITLPYDLDSVNPGNEYDKTLVSREVTRMREFYKLAINNTGGLIYETQILEAYGMSYKDINKERKDYE